MVVRDSRGRLVHRDLMVVQAHVDHKEELAVMVER